MPGSVQIRQSMVECQLQTSGVIEPALLACFKSVPREMFLPEALSGTAYTDEDLMLPEGDCMMEPLVQGRLLQAVRPQPGDTALIVGDGTGYAAALMAKLVRQVVLVETGLRALDRARAGWQELGLSNIKIAGRDAGQGPFDIIVVNGAVAAIPEALMGQLGEQGGRLSAVVRPVARDVGCLTLLERTGKALYSRFGLYDAATPYLKGFEPPQVFSF